MSELKVGQVWRHKKRGSLYRIGAIGALLQCSTYEAVEDKVGLSPWVIYFSEAPRDKEEHVYIRLESEFLDGRFELVDEP